ncbi:MAG: sensor histidine kinase [Pedobacter sp.]|nr:MAG: sensor histidine kinase [Pedobacter sp.]
MRLFKFISFQVIVLQLFAIACDAQYYFRHYQTDDGLSHSSVRSIIQDRKGFMWIGTRGGLNRFDGYKFKSYKNKADKFGYIGNDIITSLAEDQTGMLWIGTGRGVFRFNPTTEVFTKLSGINGYINQVLVDKKNNIWIIAIASLYQYDQYTRKILDYKLPASCLAIDNKQNIWFGNNDGVLSKLNPYTKKIEKIRLIEKSASKNVRSISAIFPTGDQILIGFFKKGLKSYNLKTRTISHLTLSKDKNLEIFVRDIRWSDNQNFWIATESGIYIYDLKKNTSINLRKRIGDPYAISDNAVYTVCKDDNGGIWAGTFFGGINYYSQENAKFKKYYPIPNVNSISGSAVREISADHKGNLWIGTEDAGINKINLKTQKITTYTNTNKPDEVSYPNIHGLLVTGNKLFIGPFFHGLEVMDIRTGRIAERFRYIGNKGDSLSDFVLSLYLSRDSTLYVGTAYNGSGLFIFNQKSKIFTRIKQIPYNSYVLCITEDSQGRIWTGSINEGVYHYHPKTGKSGHIKFGDRDITDFPVYGILEDKNNNMWFATEGGGLIKVNAKGQIVKKITQQNGLPSNTLFGILEDNAGNLWISSLKGLICFNIASEKIKVYTRANGLITDQFNYHSAYKDKNGTMYFGSVAGMIAFKPEELAQGQNSPPTYITEFELDNKEVSANDINSPLKKSVIYIDTLILQYNQNNFSLKFSALNYSFSDVTQYKYRMKGLTNDWTYLTTNRNAYFTDLSPGKYTFMVQARSNVGSWVGKEKMLYIEIVPPIWRSTVAYILYTLIIIILLYFAIDYYHQLQERKNANKLKLFEHEKVKEVYQAKIEFFTNIAHEIQTPLTLISVPVERVIEKIDDYPRIRKSMLMIEKNTKRLVELIGQLLDFRQTEIEQFGLNFVNVDINTILKSQIEAFREYASENTIAIKLKVPQKHVIAFVDREALIKICSNLISNAIKYATSTTSVELFEPAEGNPSLTIVFSNDGPAIPQEFRNKIFEPFFRLRRKDKSGTGIGLPLAKSLTELHKGSLILSSAEADKIVFALTLPIHQDVEFQLNSWKKIN